MKRLRGALLAMLLLGLVVFLLGVARGDAARAWGSYLVNFLFWSGLAQAGVAFLALLHVTRARWGEPLRASAESMTSFLPVSFGLALFLPLGHGSFYRWLPSASAKEQAWLSTPFVSARLLLGMALLNGLGLLFVRRAQRERLAPALLVVYACVLTLLSFDWVMSLDPRWFSTLIGGHFFIGTLYAGLAAVALLALLARPRLPPAVMHDHGKLLLGFCMLWIYMVYTQYLVIWYGDLPEETGFVLRRTAASPWAGLSAFVVASGFLVPFLLLLSRSLKLSRAGLASVAALALVGIFAERVLLVMPSLTEKGPFGIVELLVSAGFFAAFLLCILPRMGADAGGLMSRQTAGLAALIAAALAAPAAPADGQTGTWEAPPEAKSLTRPAPADAKSAERGQKLFKQNCVPCHGPAGMGDGPMGKAMGIKPGNLTNGARMSAQSDGEIFWKVSKGKDPMPIFEKKLSEKDRWDVVAYVRTLAR